MKAVNESLSRRGGRTTWMERKQDRGCGGYHDGRRTTQASIDDTLTLLHVAAVGSNATDTGIHRHHDIRSSADWTLLVAASTRGEQNRSPTIAGGRNLAPRPTTT